MRRKWRGGAAGSGRALAAAGGLWALLVGGAGCGALGGGGDGTVTPLEGAPAEVPFTEGLGALHATFDAHEPARWRRSDGWAAAPEFGAGWRADHAGFASGQLRLTLDDAGCPAGCVDRPYASGEYASVQEYGYGRYEVRMRPSPTEGTVSSFILHTGASEGTRWDEIDIEFLGKDTRGFQANYFTDGVGRHETWVPLPFDASQETHSYGIEWTREAIHWLVDGVRVHTETGARGPLPTHPGKLIMNFWPGRGIDIWTGPFAYRGVPLTTTYDEVRGGPADARTLLEDFDAAGAAEAWAVSAEGGAQLTRAAAAGRLDTSGLGAAYALGGAAGARAALSRTFAQPQDWAGVKHLTLWFHGEGRGTPFRLRVLDARGGSAAVRAEHAFTDGFAGWSFLSVPLPAAGVGVVTGLSLEPLAGSGAFRLERLELERPHPR
jgi:beta-glucanase (GH16 family)